MCFHLKTLLVLGTCTKIKYENRLFCFLGAKITASKLSIRKNIIINLLLKKNEKYNFYL